MQLRLAYSIAIQVDVRHPAPRRGARRRRRSASSEKCFATFDGFRDEGKTIVFVSHDLGTVQRYCDRVLLIRNGVAEASGPADEVIQQYVPTLATDEVS